MTADFQVTYLPNDAAWDPQARAAFQAAVDVWETLVVSNTPIRVNASWSDLGGSTLGSAGPFLCSNGGVWYGTALHAARFGTDCNGNGVDIDAEFNNCWPTCQNPGWYLGTDGNPGSNQIDFMSVVMHELGHGLAFIDSFGFSDETDQFGNPTNLPCTHNTYCWGLGTSFPVRYDQFVVNASNQVLYTAFPNNNSDGGVDTLGQQLTSNNLFWIGAQAVAANGGVKPKLYAPGAFQPGSSIAHLDEIYNGTPNALMTYSISTDESIHDPGPITLGILRDMGWSTSGSATLGTPTLSSVVPLSSTSLRVNYTYGSPAGTEIHIEHALPYQPWAFLTGDAASPYDHTALSPNSTHCYRLQAHNHSTGQVSAYSNWLCVATPAGGGAPATPTLGSVVALSSTSIQVNYSTGSPPGTEVHVEHALPYQPWAFLSGDAASPFDHTGLTPGSTHCYRLLAHDHSSGQVSAYSNWACVTTPAGGGAPAAPTMNGVVALSSTSFRVNYTYGSPAGTEVHIEHALPYQPWAFLVGDAASPYDHTGLTPGSTHCYRLLAHDHSNGLVSTYSNWACVTLP